MTLSKTPTVYTYRRLKLEKELVAQLWRISWDDIQMSNLEKAMRSTGSKLTLSLVKHRYSTYYILVHTHISQMSFPALCFPFNINLIWLFIMLIIVIISVVISHSLQRGSNYGSLLTADGNFQLFAKTGYFKVSFWQALFKCLHSNPLQ